MVKTRLKMLFVAAMALFAVPAFASFCKQTLVTHSNDFTHGLWHFDATLRAAAQLDWVMVANVNAACMAVAGVMFWVGYLFVPVLTALALTVAYVKRKHIVQYFDGRRHVYRQALA